MNTQLIFSAVADGKVIIGSEDGSVYCFGVKPAK